MANRERKNELKIYLSEQYILEQKAKASGLRNKSSFLRHQILYGNVYAADAKEVKELMKKVWDAQKSMLSKQPYMKQ